MYFKHIAKGIKKSLPISSYEYERENPVNMQIFQFEKGLINIEAYKQLYKITPELVKAFHEIMD